MPCFGMNRDDMIFGTAALLSLTPFSFLSLHHITLVTVSTATLTTSHGEENTCLDIAFKLVAPATTESP